MPIFSERHHKMCQKWPLAHSQEFDMRYSNTQGLYKQGKPEAA